MSSGQPAAEGEPPTTPLVGAASGSAHATAELTAGGITYSQTPSGEWSVERARHELKVATTAHAQQMAAEEARHRREQEARDNAQRRWQRQVVFLVAVGILLVVVAFTLLVIAFSASAATRQNAWSLLGVIVGGVVGGIAGYFTGKAAQ